jgi:class 3 adenylate cyclase
MEQSLIYKTSMNNSTNKTLEKWAGAKLLNLALVFTDIVDSTAIGQKLGDRVWMPELANHFKRGRELASKYDCFVVKVIGDAFMVAFRNSTEAVEFAMEFAKDTGVDFIGIRAGIHSGQVQIMDNDIYGLNVNKTARIQSSIKFEGIRVSTSVKEDFRKAYGTETDTKFISVNIDLKNFGTLELWNVISRELRQVFVNINKERNKILGKIPPTMIVNSDLNVQNTSKKSSTLTVPPISVSDITSSNKDSNSISFKLPLLEPPRKK